MRKSDLRISIMFAADILGPMIGGGKTFLNGFIKYAPKDFMIDYIGISSDVK